MGELKLLPCTHADIPEILAAQIAAFSTPHEPFFFVLFPKTEDRERAERKALEWWVSDKSARYMKVVDVDSGKIISAAKWCIYEDPLTEQEMNEVLHVGWHEDADTNEWAEYLIHSIHSYRLRRTKGARCCVLDILSTHPSHQRLGAGKMLVQWGTAIADSMGVESFIEGTILARPLYESCGFRVVPDEWIVVPVPEKWKNREDRPEIRYRFYEREVGEKSVEGLGRGDSTS